MHVHPLIVDCTYPVAIERVWDALTLNQQLQQWYFKLPEFKPEVGFEFSFEGGKDNQVYVHLCTIEEVIEKKKLQYSWQYQGYEGFTLVTFELFAEGNFTRLRLTHTGLDSFPANNPDLSRERFQEGWNYILGTSLANYLKGQILDTNR